MMTDYRDVIEQERAARELRKEQQRIAREAGLRCERKDTGYEPAKKFGERYDLWNRDIDTYNRVENKRRCRAYEWITTSPYGPTTR